VNEGMKRLSFGGSAVDLKNELESRRDEILENLKEISTEVSVKGEIQNIASISANDKDLGKVIADVFDKIGKDGVVTIEDGNTYGVESKIIDGLQFDKGAMSPYMLENVNTEFTSPYIMVCNESMTTDKFAKMETLLQSLIDNDCHRLVIIADEFDKDVIASMVVMKLEGKFFFVAVKSPGFAEKRQEQLEDISAMIGGLSPLLNIMDSMALSLEKRQVADAEKNIKFEFEELNNDVAFVQIYYTDFPAITREGVICTSKNNKWVYQDFSEDCKIELVSVSDEIVEKYLNK
jgi:hypothetical protein